MPELLDVVELLIDMPDHNLHKGDEGTIVERYTDGTYEVEFADERGETIALCTLKSDEFKVIWRSKEHIQRSAARNDRPNR
ncbi:MAG: DUF4926 domain-containing protein [Chloroflexi bacterium]|nr:DUF4926 domain-containing protein [Chloroflexota bacterium]